MGIWVCPQVICSATHPLSLHQCCRGLTSPRYSTRSCVALVETCYCRTTCRRTGRRRASTFAYTAPRVCPRWWLDWWRTSRRRSQASPRTSSTRSSSSPSPDTRCLLTYLTTTDLLQQPVGTANSRPAMYVPRRIDKFLLSEKLMAVVMMMMIPVSVFMTHSQC